MGILGRGLAGGKVYCRDGFEIRGEDAGAKSCGMIVHAVALRYGIFHARLAVSCLEGRDRGVSPERGFNLFTLR